MHLIQNYVFAENYKKPHSSLSNSYTATLGGLNYEVRLWIPINEQCTYYVCAMYKVAVIKPNIEASDEQPVTSIHVAT